MSSTSTPPAGYNTVMPYLVLRDAAQFIHFMKTVFDAKETHRVMRGELIQHAQLMLGESTIMLSDATDHFGVKTAGMFLYVPDADTAYQKALDAGAKSIMPPSDQPYGRSCGITDPFGNDWWPTTTPKA